ncbi:hypothetical protein FRC15_003232 [Serendipita sp. 397]|nr:hypothetical protein FRC16_006815 [Serendipita sp. 398]KAG8771729.1 hypothetical protein FRC15_003232 [Serendipita sp. 397]
MDPPQSTSISTRSSPEPSESSASDTESDLDKVFSPKKVKKKVAKQNGKQASESPKQLIMIAEEMTEDMYPETFRPLMKAVITQCQGQIGVNVHVESIRRVLGKMEQFKSLGWSNLTVWVKAACTADYLTRGGKGKSRWVSLRPLTPATSSPNHIQAEDSSPARGEEVLPQVHLGDYPRDHYGLVAAVLQLTVGRALLKVQYEDVKEVMKQAGKGYNLSDASLIHMLAQASRAGVVSYGKSDNGIWIQVELPPFGTNPATPEPPVVHTQPTPNEIVVPDPSPAEKFSMLLNVLMVLREKHKIDYTPVAMVAETLVSMAPDVFHKAGFSSILEYLVAAQRVGIVTITGLGNQQMIGLV